MASDDIRFDIPDELTWVIVNRYAGDIWGCIDRWPNAARFPSREHAENFVRVERAADPREMDDDECVVMTLAQYLVEFGQ